MKSLRFDLQEIENTSKDEENILMQYMAEIDSLQ